MAYVRTYTIDATPGGDTVKVAVATKLNGDLTNVFTYLNTHEALTATHGATGAVVGTTNTQTLTNKTLTSPIVSSPDIDGGTIDGATIATSNITVGAGKTLDVSAGTLTLANDQISGDKVEGGAINAITINTVTTQAITAPANTLVIKPTTDATTAIQIADKDGNAILTADTVNNVLVYPYCVIKSSTETLAGQDGVTVTHNYGSTSYLVKTNVTGLGNLSKIGDIAYVKAANTVVIYNSGIPGITVDVEISATT